MHIREGINHQEERIKESPRSVNLLRSLMIKAAKTVPVDVKSEEAAAEGEPSEGCYRRAKEGRREVGGRYVGQRNSVDWHTRCRTEESYYEILTEARLKRKLAASLVSLNS